MKTFYNFILLLFIINISYPQSSGWFLQTSGINTDLYSVHFEDGLTGCICGANGVILKSTNGGNNWLQQTSSTSSALRTIYFVNPYTGWAAGDNGVILHTTNGGSNWYHQNQGISSISYKTSYFINSATGWIAGSNGTIIKTINSGQTWVGYISQVTTDINSLYFISASSGWAAGNSGKILKTTDGGTWTINIDHGEISNFYSIFFTTPQRGIAAGKYTDAQGNNFVYFYKTDCAGLWWEYQYANTTKILRSVFFADSLNGWAAGDSGFVSGTTDKGVTWIPQYSRTYNNLTSLYFLNRSVGYAVGLNGTVIKTVNAGYRDTLNTNRRDAGVLPIVLDVYQMRDARYRVQFTAPDTNYNILRSLDNGQTYTPIFTNIQLTDTGSVFDGILLKVYRIRYRQIGSYNQGDYQGNVGVVQDPTSLDSVQTRLYGWDYFPEQNRFVTGSKFKPTNKPWQSRSMSICYPTKNSGPGFRSLLNPEDLRKVKIVFTGYGNGQIAYRYQAVTGTNYQYKDIREVPFKVYEVDETDSTTAPRQVNVAFCEYDANPDFKWQPTADSLSNDVLYIFRSNYSNQPDSFYMSKNLLIQQPQIDVMYMWCAKLIAPGMSYHINDEFYIYPYTVTRPDIVQGYPLYYEFITHSIIGIEPISTSIPKIFELMQNYPNPFNPRTKIKFDLPAPGLRQAGIPPLAFGEGQGVRLVIYNILGQQITTLVNEPLKPGTYEVEWDGTNYSSGVYFYQLITGDYIQSRKMLMVK